MSARPKKLSWTPVRRGKVYCSPACGGDCTWAAHYSATRNAAALAKRCGPAFKPVVWENLGWHYRAETEDRRVTIRQYAGQYQADVGGYHGYGTTPQAALDAAVSVALADVGDTLTSVASAHAPRPARKAAS